MTDLIERHRALAMEYRRRDGLANASLCKLHNDTADEIERLQARSMDHKSPLCTTYRSRMSDLVERLRESYEKDCFLMEVADEIERLLSRIEELEDKLRHSDRKEIEACYRAMNKKDARIAELRWLKSKAYVSSVDHWAGDRTKTNKWTITFTSSCATIDNAIKQAMKLDGLCDRCGAAYPKEVGYCTCGGA